MENKKSKRELIGLIAVLAGLLLCLLILIFVLRSCGSEPVVQDPTTEATTEMTTSPTVETTTETTAETTEATTEATEETTEPTSGGSAPGGTSGYNPGSSNSWYDNDEDEEEKEEEETVTITAPGTETNPYVECVDKVPAALTTVKIPAGGSISYAVYGASSRILTISDPNVTVTYNGKTYAPDEKGLVTLTVERTFYDVPAQLTLTNSGSAEKAFKLNLEAGLGSQENPYPLVMGEFTTMVTVNDENGVFYAYTAAEAGMVTIRCQSVTEGVSYDYVFYNETAGEYRTLAADGVIDENGVTTLSITVKAGDRLLLNVDTLNNETENAEKAKIEASFTSLADFSAGAQAPGITAERIAYTVSVKDDAGAAVPGVALTLHADGVDISLTTDANGGAASSLPKGSYSLTLTVPEGYTSGTTEYSFGETSSLEITLKKPHQEEEKPEETPETPEIPEGFDGTYTVTVTDYSGAPVTGVAVQFLQDGAQKAIQVVDENGKATVKLDPAKYTVTLAFTTDGLYYEDATAVLTPTAPELTVSVTGAVPAATGDKLYNGSPEYTVDVGGTYVTMQADVVNYFLFVPTQSGLYQFTTSDPSAIISFQGGSTMFIADLTASTDYDAATNTFTRNVKEGNLGGTYIIGVTGTADCILEITRIGDAVLDVTDMEAEEYVPAVSPVQQTLSLSGTMTYVDLTGSASVVKGTDGYYHLNSADGPIVYVNLGKDARYISFYNMLGISGIGGTSFSKVFYDENGTAVKKEEYTKSMIAYTKAVDSKTGLYPLNDDLIYMIQNGGEYKGWWDSENGNYLFGEVTNLNTAIAWMFACCYYQ